MEPVYFIGNLLTLAVLAAIVVLAYRTLWQALIVPTPAGNQVTDLFSDDDPSREFWLEPTDGSSRGRRVGTGMTIGSDPKADLQIPGGPRQLQLLPYRDWCALEALDTTLTYAVDDQPVQGNSLLKEGQCLTIGDLSIRLTRRPL